jgi:hypothetical protein
VSCYAVIIGWLLLSLPPSHLSKIFTTFTLRYYLKTLADVLDCFPFDYEPSRPLSDCCNLILFNFRRLDKFGTVQYRPHVSSGSTINKPIQHSTSIDFVENQLLPALISLSPLSTSHPSIFPQTTVQSSKTF